MALQDRLTNPPPPKIHGTPCSVGVLVAGLPEDEAQALHKMLYELDWTAPQVYEALTAEGHTVARQSINRHRSGMCRCAK